MWLSISINFTANTVEICDGCKNRKIPQVLMNPIKKKVLLHAFSMATCIENGINKCETCWWIQKLIKIWIKPQNKLNYSISITSKTESRFRRTNNVHITVSIHTHIQKEQFINIKYTFQIMNPSFVFISVRILMIYLILIFTGKTALLTIRCRFTSTSIE